MCEGSLSIGICLRGAVDSDHLFFAFKKTVENSFNQWVTFTLSLIFAVIAWGSPYPGLANSLGNEGVDPVLLGVKAIPRHTEAEVEGTPIKELRSSVREYAETFLAAYEIEYSKARNLADPIPNTVKDEFIHFYDTLSDAEILERSKEIYRSGGVERINSKTYGELDSIVQKWEKKTYNKVFERYSKDLSPGGVERRLGLHFNKVQNTKIAFADQALTPWAAPLKVCLEAVGVLSFLGYLLYGLAKEN